MKTTFDFHQLTPDEVEALRRKYGLYARMELRIEAKQGILFACDVGNGCTLYGRDPEWDPENPVAVANGSEWFELLTTDTRELEEYLADIAHDYLVDEIEQVRRGDREEEGVASYIAALKEELYLDFCEEHGYDATPA